MELSKRDKIVFLNDLWSFADYKSLPLDDADAGEYIKPQTILDVQSLNSLTQKQAISDYCDLVFHELTDLAEKYNTFIVDDLLHLDHESESDMENIRYYKERLFVKLDDVLKVCNSFIDKYAQTSNKAKEKLLFNSKGDNSLVDLYAYMYVKMFYDILNEIEPLTTTVEQFDETVANKL